MIDTIIGAAMVIGGGWFLARWLYEAAGRHVARHVDAALGTINETDPAALTPEERDEFRRITEEGWWTR